MARVAPATVQRRRRAAAIAALVVLAAIAAVVLRSGSDDGGKGRGARAAALPAPAQLPGGGREILPHYRVVAYYGAPQAAQLGELGIGSPSRMAKRLARQARPYRAGGRPVLLAMELIVAIAANAPGDDGLYRTRQPDAIVERYLRAARRAKAILILDIQPGHADFFNEAVHLEKWLREPDVSLALDPEWHLPPGQVPGKVIGSVDAREVNAVSFWLAGLVKRNRLPQKLLLIHRFTADMIGNEQRLKKRPGLALTVNVDGFGGNAVKIAKYRAFAHRARSGIHNGFKLFYHEDVATLSPRQVLRDVHPRPEVIVYE